MRLKTFFGFCIIFLIALVPIFLWFIFGPGFDNLRNYDSITHSLGQFAGLVGMTLFALTFILSTRLNFLENTFGGLDKVYRVHAVVGGTALILILFHPILLVIKFVPSDITRAAGYLLPGSFISVNLGIIAFLLLIILLFITLFTHLRYNRWKFTHEFLGLTFLFAVLHIFLVRRTAAVDGNIFDGYYIYATIVSLIGISTFLYSLLIRGRYTKNFDYFVKDIKKEKDVFEINMLTKNRPLQYKSGQFVFVKFYNKELSREAHPFSIASKSNDPILRIVVKKLGDFTNELGKLNVGDKVVVEGPYGRFNYKNYYNKDLVWLAGGIGITPFIGMVQNLDRVKGTVYLYYSVKNESDFVYYDLLKNIEERNKNLRFIPWVSEKQGHITIAKVQESIKDFKNKEFFLCGPSRFKESLINGLLERGVSKENIHEESFDFK